MKRAATLAATLAMLLECAPASSAAGADRVRASGCSVVVPAVRPLAAIRFAFPRDQGAHDAFALETWRAFGRLSGPGDERYDYVALVTRARIPRCDAHALATNSRWFAGAFVAAAYAIVRESTQTIERAGVVEREGSLGASVTRGRLGVRAGPFRLTALGSHGVRIAVDSRGSERGLSLASIALGTPIALGPGGVMRTGACAACEAYGYAYVRAPVRGTLDFAGARVPVAGTTWFEHEYADEEVDGSEAGWDRFALQFDDGRAVETRVTRDRAGRPVTTSGMSLDRAGRVTYLRAGDAGASNFPPNTTWRSDVTGTRYPSIWAFGVRQAHLGLVANEVMLDQEIALPERAPIFEGAIVVEKADPPGGDHGHGYVELTGYGLARRQPTRSSPSAP